MHTFGVPNGNPFCELSREFRVVVSAATGTERVLVPGAEIVLEMVRMAVIEQCPSLMPTLYPGVMAAEPRPFGTLDATCLAFQSLANSKTPAINDGLFFYLPAFSSDVRPPAPPGPRPAGNGRGQGRTPSQSPAWQTGSRINCSFVVNVSKPIPGCTDPWLDASSNCWPLNEHHCAEIFAVCSSVQTNDPPLWRGLLTPTARAAAPRESGGHCLNCHEDTHSLRVDTL